MTDAAARARQIAESVDLRDDGSAVSTRASLARDIADALLAAEARGRAAGLREAHNYAMSRCGTGATASHLGVSIAEGIRALIVKEPHKDVKPLPFSHSFKDDLGGL